MRSAVNPEELTGPSVSRSRKEEAPFGGDTVKNSAASEPKRMDRGGNFDLEDKEGKRGAPSGATDIGQVLMKPIERVAGHIDLRLQKQATQEATRVTGACG